MSRSEKALDMFNRGFNCSQAVFSVFAQDLKLDEKTALRIATGFGGGMARQGETCGAVTGALMVLGLRHGMDLESLPETKETTYSRAQRFMEEFKRRQGSVVCREILGCDLSTPEGAAQAKEKGLFKTVCPKAVKDAVEILEEMR